MSQTSNASRAANRDNNGNGAEISLFGSASRWLRGLFRRRNGESRLRDTFEEIIETIKQSEGEEAAAMPIGSHEKILLGNIVKLRHLTAHDVMVPRADIVSIEIDVGLEELIEVMSRAGHSRLPVYRDNLDDVIGIVHIKDVLKYAKDKTGFEFSKIMRTVLIVVPSMRALDLLLEMRISRVHMALVVDEFGGVDGMITIEDLVEEIVGEIEDEHDVAEGPKLVEGFDGSVVADARATIEDLEALAGPVLSAEERAADIDTLGGLVFFLADRVPTRGELIVHPPSGISFEVMEADPRRVKRLRLRNLPSARSARDGDG